MEPRTLSEGEYRVGISFNPGGNPVVDEIKTTVAALIDKLGPISKHPTNPAAARCASIAMTELESAAMWAVKAVTKPDR